jgi:hypothetical protein
MGTPVACKAGPAKVFCGSMSCTRLLPGQLYPVHSDLKYPQQRQPLEAMMDRTEPCLYCQTSIIKPGSAVCGIVCCFPVLVRSCHEPLCSPTVLLGYSFVVAVVSIVSILHELDLLLDSARHGEYGSVCWMD